MALVKTLVKAIPTVDLGTVVGTANPVVKWTISVDYFDAGTTLQFREDITDPSVLGVDPYTVSQSALVALMPAYYDTAFDNYLARFSTLPLGGVGPYEELDEDNATDAAITTVPGAPVSTTTTVTTTVVDTLGTTGVPAGTTIGTGTGTIVDTFIPTTEVTTTTANPEFFDWTLMPA